MERGISVQVLVATKIDDSRRGFIYSVDTSSLGFFFIKVVIL